MGLTPAALAALVQATRQGAQNIGQGAQNMGAPPPPMGTVPNAGPSVLPPQLFPQGPTSPDQPPAAGVLPPTSPMGSQVAGLMAIPEYQRLIQEQEQNRQQLGTEMWRQKALATPANQVVPGTGEGGQPGLAGEMPKMQWGSKNKLVNALLNILGSTNIGEAVQAQEYREPRRSWEAQTKATAQSIQDIKDQAAITGEQQKAIGTAALGAGNMAIRQQKADIYAQSVKNHLEIATRGLDLKSMQVGSQMDLNKAKEALDYALAQTAPQHIELGYSDQQARLAIADQARNTELAKLPWFTRFINGWTGTPAAPPLQQQTPLSPKPGTPANTPEIRYPSGKRRVIDLTK